MMYIVSEQSYPPQQLLTLIHSTCEIPRLYTQGWPPLINSNQNIMLPGQHLVVSVYSFPDEHPHRSQQHNDRIFIVRSFDFGMMMGAQVSLEYGRISYPSHHIKFSYEEAIIPSRLFLTPSLSLAWTRCIFMIQIKVGTSQMLVPPFPWHFEPF